MSRSRFATPDRLAHLVAAVVLLMAVAHSVDADLRHLAAREAAADRWLSERESRPSGPDHPPVGAEAGRAWAKQHAEVLSRRPTDPRRLLPVTWFAGVSPASLSPAEQALLAVATAALLSAPAPLPAAEATAGLAALRELQPRPPAARLLPTYTRSGAPWSIDLDAELIVRSGLETPKTRPVSVAEAVRIRRGGNPAPESWRTVGLSGLLALEVLRAQRRDLLPEVCALAQDPPGPADGAAAAYTLAHLGPCP